MRYSATLDKLAQAFREGHDCTAALHDALIEAGFPYTADQHFGIYARCCTPGSGCSAIAAILGSNYDGRYFEVTLEDMESWKGLANPFPPAGI